MIETLFPNGVFQYAVGGLLAGLGVAVIYLGTAITPGASTFLESTLSYFSGIERFQKYRPSRDWRLLFTLSIIGGAGIYAALFQNGIFVTEVSMWRLFAGGVLVGIGTRIGKGCTSGHGINGVGSVSRASLINVAIFVLVAIITALTVQAAGVTP
jgi:uncharacterized membrane protein YedE/YeeE